MRLHCPARAIAHGGVAADDAYAFFAHGMAGRAREPTIAVASGYPAFTPAVRDPNTRGPEDHGSRCTDPLPYIQFTTKQL